MYTSELTYILPSCAPHACRELCFTSFIAIRFSRLTNRQFRSFYFYFLLRTKIKRGCLVIPNSFFLSLLVLVLLICCGLWFIVCVAVRHLLCGCCKPKPIVIELSSFRCLTPSLYSSSAFAACGFRFRVALIRKACGIAQHITKLQRVCIHQLIRGKLLFQVHLSIVFAETGSAPIYRLVFQKQPKLYSGT